MSHRASAVTATELRPSQPLSYGRHYHRATAVIRENCVALFSLNNFFLKTCALSINCCGAMRFKKFKSAIAFCVLSSCFTNCVLLLRRNFFKVVRPTMLMTICHNWPSNMAPTAWQILQPTSIWIYDIVFFQEVLRLRFAAVGRHPGTTASSY